jgi:hypothetical protein
MREHGAPLESAENQPAFATRFGSPRAAHALVWVPDVPFANRRINWNQSKTRWQYNGLLPKRDRVRVLFVQHPFKNGQTACFGSGSFIACA